jgi:hypothetical protein
MAQMLEYRVGQIPQTYMALLDCLLTPGLLEHEGCVPSVVRLLGTFFETNASQILDRLVCRLFYGIFSDFFLIFFFTDDGPGNVPASHFYQKIRP